MKSIPLTFAILLAMASTAAIANSHSGHDANAPGPMPGMGHGMMGMGHGMMGMDKMSPEQHQKMMDEMFAQMDADNNGSVTKAEFSAHHAKMMARHQEMMARPQPKPETAPAPAPETAPEPEPEHKH